MPATKEYNQKYYEEHKEYYREHNRRWMIEHRDQVRERHRKYREENREKIVKQQRALYDAQSELLHKKAVEEAEARTRLTEEWRAIPGFEGIYDISNWGLIRRLTERGIYSYSKGSKDKDGYYRFVLHKDGAKTKKGVHYLVALAFIPVPEELKDCEVLEVHHINENPANNLVWNLMWVTKKMNINAGTRTERARQTRMKKKTED